MLHLLDEIAASHFPRAPATLAQLAAFEARTGWQLDADMRAFYLRMDGATLFERWPDQTFQVLPLAEIQPAGLAMRPGQARDEQGSASWWTLVSLGDDDYVVADVSRREQGCYPLLDAYHETFPRQVVQIAPSFGAWLERTLASDNQLWWLPEPKND
ncbi:SMI1/KNR4 family protein [Myxococcus sp. 1LA]